MRSLSPEDWSSFLKYSAHVRYLGSYGPLTVRRLDDRAVTMISMYRPALVLFPRLVGIKLWPIWLGESDYPAVLGLVGSYIKEVSIQWNLEDDPERHLQTCISLISDRKSTRLNSSHSGESRMPSSA